MSKKAKLFLFLLIPFILFLNLILSAYNTYTLETKSSELKLSVDSLRYRLSIIATVSNDNFEDLQSRVDNLESMVDDLEY